MGAPRKYPDELRGRAVRMAVEARRDPATKAGALARIRQQLGINPEKLRNWVRQTEVDEGCRPGTATDDAQPLVELERGLGGPQGQCHSADGLGFLRGRREFVLPIQQVVAYIAAHKGEFGVEPICRFLIKAGTQVAPGTYYAFKTRPPSARSVSDAATTAVTAKVNANNYGVYGLTRFTPSCAGMVIERHGARCTSLLRATGLRGIVRSKGPRTTVAGAGPETRPDLVERAFTAAAPDRLWVGRHHLLPHVRREGLRRVRPRRVLLVGRGVAAIDLAAH